METILKTTLSKEVRCKVTLTTDEEFKTKPQLAYWFAVVIPNAVNGLRANGYSDMNEEKADWMLRKEFYSESVWDLNGVAVTYPLSFTEISKEDMSILIDNTICWCAENLNIIIPPPPPK